MPKRVTITLDQDVADWLEGRTNGRHSLSERVRICLREYMVEHPARFVSEKGNGATIAPSLHKGGMHKEILDAWEGEG